MSRINQVRRDLEAELTRVTGKPSTQLTERLIDLIREVRDELRKADGK